MKEPLPKALRFLFVQLQCRYTSKNIMLRNFFLLMSVSPGIYKSKKMKDGEEESYTFIYKSFKWLSSA